MTRAKRGFGAVDKLPSGRWRLRYSDVAGARLNGLCVLEMERPFAHASEAPQPVVSRVKIAPMLGAVHPRVVTTRMRHGYVMATMEIYARGH